MKNASVSRHNRTALALLLIAAAAMLLMLLQPVYTFRANIYEKKYANTFVGDEKYQEGLAVAEEIKEEYIADGMDVTLDESVIERTNSKGKTTSMVTFTISRSFTKSALSFVESGLPSAWIMCLILFCLLASAACGIAGSAWSMQDSDKTLTGLPKALRSASAVAALGALLLVPVFVMTNTYALGRRITLYTGDVITEGKEEYFALLDRFLFDGTAGDSIDTMLKALDFDLSPVMWLAAVCAFVMLLGAVQLRFGSIRHTLLRGIMYAFIIVVCVVTLYPYYVMVVTAFRSSSEANDMYFRYLFPTEWKFENLTHIMQRSIPQYLLNSLIIAGGSTLVALVCGIPAAYAMARMKFKAKKAFLGFIIMSQMFSPIVLLIGIAQLMSNLNLNDSLLGLIFINAAFNQAFAIWLLRGTFISISPEMEQAARIDGCSTLGSLWHVLLPMAAPGIVTTLIFIFINAWNEYTISTVLISTMSKRPITVGITQFSSFNMIEWQYLFASSLLATIPVVILFMLIEKHLTSGLTSGGVKG